MDRLQQLFDKAHHRQEAYKKAISKAKFEEVRIGLGLVGATGP
jgi:hypothetical protein